MWDNVRDENTQFKMHFLPFTKLLSVSNYLRYDRRSAHVIVRNWLYSN